MVLEDPQGHGWDFHVVLEFLDEDVLHELRHGCSVNNMVEHQTALIARGEQLMHWIQTAIKDMCLGMGLTDVIVSRHTGAMSGYLQTHREPDNRITLRFNQRKVSGGVVEYAVSEAGPLVAIHVSFCTYVYNILSNMCYNTRVSTMV